MKFWEAMKALDEGKKAVCTSDLKLIPLGFDLNQLMSSHWELCEETKQALSFAEVVQGMKEGKKFGRKGFNGYIFQSQGRIIKAENGRPWGPYEITKQDLDASDWFEGDL